MKYQDCPGHDFTDENNLCSVHAVPFCKHCGNCSLFIKNKMAAKTDDLVVGWDTAKDGTVPEDKPVTVTEKPQNEYICTCQSGGTPHSGGDTWKTRWAPKENQAGKWITICEGHKDNYKNSLYFDKVRKIEPDVLTKADLKKAVDKLKNAGSKQFFTYDLPKIKNYTDFYTPAAIKTAKANTGYQFSYKFVDSLGLEVSDPKQNTVLERIKTLIKCGSEIVRQTDEGKTPDDNSLKAFDLALKNLRETGE